MWIRSQDEEILVNLDCIAVLKHSKLYENMDSHGPTHSITALVNGNEIELGCYYSEQRVMEIFEEIEDEIVEDASTIYYMPDK